MIFIVIGAILFVFGMLLLAIGITASLVSICGQPEPEAAPFITINIYLDEADNIASTIELPRQSFRRLRD
jgi:hypothetical protein